MNIREYDEKSIWRKGDGEGGGGGGGYAGYSSSAIPTSLVIGGQRLGLRQLSFTQASTLDQFRVLLEIRGPFD